MQDRCPPPSGSHLEIIATKRHKNCVNKKSDEGGAALHVAYLAGEIPLLKTRPESDFFSAEFHPVLLLNGMCPLTHAHAP